MPNQPDYMRGLHAHSLSILTHKALTLVSPKSHAMKKI